ncbi:MAG: hypothetical protein ABI851_11140, partial [Saprospiraceae bacterium]
MKIAILFILPLLLTAQGKRDYIWLLGGNRTFTTDTNFQGFQLDFNSKPLSIYVKDRPNPIIRQNNASICDKNGNLLMYTAGCNISDRLFKPMPNGKINEGFVWDFSCNRGDYGVFNGSLIIPATIDKNKYIVLHKFVEFDIDTLAGVTCTKLLYSVVDMNQNNGYGDLISKNNIAIEKYLSFSELSGTRHTNNLDWWIISPGTNNNYYYKLKLHGTLVDFDSEQRIGSDFIDYGG